MTDWLSYSEADFDATRAPRPARKRQTEQAGLFFVATPVKAPTTKPAAAQLPGQEPMFDDTTETGEQR